MERHQLTVIEAFNQFWQVWENVDKRSLTCIGLYFYLVKQWNACGRPITFRHRNTKVTDELGVSKPTLVNTRNTLKQVGLIDFYSRGKGDPNITYSILVVNKEVKKENNLASDFTSDFTSPFTHNQSTELFLIVSREVKLFDYLKNLFLADVGVQMKWADNGFRAEALEDGVRSFLIFKSGSEYPNFKELRQNFLRWIPSYSMELKRKNEATKRNNDGTKPGGGKMAALEQW